VVHRGHISVSIKVQNTMNISEVSGSFVFDEVDLADNRPDVVIVSSSSLVPVSPDLVLPAGHLDYRGNENEAAVCTVTQIHEEQSCGNRDPTVAGISSCDRMTTGNAVPGSLTTSHADLTGDSTILNMSAFNFKQLGNNDADIQELKKQVDDLEKKVVINIAKLLISEGLTPDFLAELSSAACTGRFMHFL